MKFYTLILGLLFLFGCSKDKKDGFTDEIIMLVDSKYVDTLNSAIWHADKSLYIKIEGEGDWYPLYNNGIEGFDYVEGFDYKLQIQRTYVKNPPADGSHHIYKLIKILEKEPK